MAKTDSYVEHVTETVDSNEEWQNDKSKLDQEQARQLAVQYDPNSPEEKKLVRKLDWRLVVGTLLNTRKHAC